MKELDILRKQIDDIDSQLKALIKKRFAVAKKILHIKKKNMLKVYQPGREKKILEKMKIEVRPIFKVIIKQTRKFQQKKWK